MVSRGQFLHRIPQRVAAGRDYLLAHGWLAQTPPAFQDAILDIVIWRTAMPGEHLSYAGDAEGGLFGVALGTVEVAFEAGHPDTPFVNLAHPGFWAGYRPLLGKRRNVYVKARTRTLWVLAPQRAVSAMLREKPEYWLEVARMADSAYEISSQIMVDLTRRDGLVRVAATLLRLAGCRHSDPVPGANLEIRVPQHAIAALAVMARNTMGLYLRELSDRGHIRLNYGSIELLGAAQLRALVEADE